MTNAKSSQNNSISATEMCDATLTNGQFDRVQFIGRTTIPFSLPDFMIELSELWIVIRGWALHS